MAERTTGFAEWRSYVLGEGDGMAKTPEWAEAESGVPAREIRALAREWASKPTMLAAGGLGGMGGACRAATGNEWARAMVALAAMQGLGKPGRNIWGTTAGAPTDQSFVFPGYSEGGISCDPDHTAAGFRWVYRMFPKGGAMKLWHHGMRRPDRAAPAHPRGHAPRAASSGGARASAAPTSRRSSANTSTRPTATPRWACTTATAARSSAP